ncbi:MAG: tetratricopeptide repeat protein [Anaerolineaceae bacterium]
MSDPNNPIKSDIEKARVFALQADILRLNEKYEEAILLFNHAIDLQNNDSWTFAHRGETYCNLGKYENAIADFEHALALDDKNDWALAGKGETYRIIGDYPKALADLQQVLQLNPENAWALARLGEVHRTLKNYDDALMYLNQALQIDVESAWAYLCRGRTHLEKNEYMQSLSDFNNALDLDQKNASIVINTTTSYHHFEKYEKTLNTINRSQTLTGRGVTYRLMDKYQEALSDLNQAIKINSNSSWAFANRGVTYRCLNNYVNAFADFDHAIELDPRYSWAIIQRGDTHRMNGSYDKALKDFNLALELDDKDSWTYACRGEAYRSNKQYEEAIRDFNRAIELSSNYTYAYAHRGETYHAMKKYNKALEDFDRTLELDPQNKWAAERRKEVLVEAEKRTTEKLRMLKKEIDDREYFTALELEPDASSAVIIDRVTDLMEELQSKEYRSIEQNHALVNEIIQKLNQVQSVLTEKRQDYQSACSLRDQIERVVEAKYGPFAPQFLNENIWKFVWEIDYTKLVHSSAKAKDFGRDTERIVAQLPGIELPKREIKIGEIKCTLTYKNNNCPKCGGKGHIHISNTKAIKEIEERKKILDELSIKYSSAALSSLLDGSFLNEEAQLEKEIPCPECVKEIMFEIPKGVKKGWILKSKEGYGSRTSFLRINEITR